MTNRIEDSIHATSEPSAAALTVNRAAVILLAIGLAACDAAPAENRQPAANSPGQNTNWQTTYRFNGEVGGCRLYYVNPTWGSSFHFAACGNNTTTAWREGCGKSCSRDVAVSTNER